MEKTLKVQVTFWHGSPSGVVQAEIPFVWSGRVYAVPRKRINDLGSLSEFAKEQSGVYLLLSRPATAQKGVQAYVGESENLLERLTQHVATKEWWHVAIPIVSTSEFSKSHLLYLETQLYHWVKSAGRAKLNNSEIPKYEKLSDSDAALMDEFLNGLRLVLPMIGYDLLKPDGIAVSDGASANEARFVIDKADYKAEMVARDGQFVVLAGSTARSGPGAPSWRNYRDLRNELISKGRLIETDDPNALKFVEDVTFDSASASASCVVARAENGRDAWRHKVTDQTFGDWDDERKE